MADGELAFVRKFTQGDLAASTIRATLAVAGPLGAIVSEFLTQFVPDQRLDRLQEFTEILGERLSGVEKQFESRLDLSAGYAALAEETFVAAVRSPHQQRRRDLAHVLRHGLTRSDADLIEEQTLLQVLDYLNEAQIVILMAYGSFEQTFGGPEREAFYRQHPAVFVEQPGYGSADSGAVRRWTMHEHYKAGLIAQNLLEDTEGIARSPVRQLRVTPLGSLLLEAIGRGPDGKVP